ANFAGGMAKGFAKGAIFQAVMGNARELGEAHAAASSKVSDMQGTTKTDGHEGQSNIDSKNSNKKPSPPVVKNAGGNVQAVKNDLSKLSTGILERLNAAEVTIVAVEDSVTEYFSELIGVTPRGWPEGMTWDTVPGLYDPDTKTVVVATSGRFGTGSYSLLLHEVGHAYDHVMSSLSSSTPFRAARAADIGSLDRYQLQIGNAGLEETFAESFANYYGGNENYKNTNPNLYKYWRGK
ncbi:hypothetical protein VT06_16365, partial [Arsukibacterium sp. MJ3]|uniref:anthrax toxin lethal factor-related metalloendopeptidase n=1 Tax=Arsukibacterium sp. MJ3 TaxID=1632859 RepID=UPI00062710B3